MQKKYFDEEESSIIHEKCCIIKKKTFCPKRPENINLVTFTCRPHHCYKDITSQVILSRHFFLA